MTWDLPHVHAPPKDLPGQPGHATAPKRLPIMSFMRGLDLCDGPYDTPLSYRVLSRRT
jgi:hypothetical protein